MADKGKDYKPAKPGCVHVFLKDVNSEVWRRFRGAATMHGWKTLDALERLMKAYANNQVALTQNGVERPKKEG